MLLIAAWEPVLADGKLTVERRPVQVNGRDLYEVRVSTSSRCTPAQMGETLWKHHEYPQFVPHLKHLEVLKTDGDTKLVYQQAGMPVVKDRDYVLQVVRSWDPANQVYESIFTARTDAGPPPSDKYVRITTLRGRWTIAPGEVNYQVLADPGDSIPTWLLNNAQKSAAPDLVKAMVARCEKTHASAK